jgi:hypothetical protein
MTLVASVRIGNLHGPYVGSDHIGMRDWYSSGRIDFGMCLVAVGAGDTLTKMIRRVPGQRRHSRVTSEAEIGACLGSDASVWVVAR